MAEAQGTNENKADLGDIATSPDDEEPVAAWGDWEEWKNDDGQSYYFNKKTEESVWEDPRSEEERKVMENEAKQTAVQTPDFLPREALAAALLKRAGAKSASASAKVDAGPTLPEINTIREDAEETVRSLRTSRTSSRKRGISEYTEYSDSEDETLRARGSSAADSAERKRFLLRIDSARDWQGNELAQLHDEMQEQLEKMTENARQSGLVVPKLHKRAPRTAPPLPPPKKPTSPSLQVLETTKSASPSVFVMDEPKASPSPAPPRPTTLPPKPPSMPPKPTAVLPTAPPLEPTHSDDEGRARSASPFPSPAPSPSNSVRSTQSLPGPKLVAKRKSTIQLNNVPFTVVASWCPEANSRTKIEIQPGDEVLVVKQGSSGWWLGKNLRTNKSGYFPGSFCKPALGDNSGVSGLSTTSMKRATSAPYNSTPHLKPTRPPPRPGRPPKKVSGMWRGSGLFSGKLMAERSLRKKKRDRAQTAASSAAAANPTYPQSKKYDYEW